MTSPFMTKPPLHIGRAGLWNYTRDIISAFKVILWHSVVPFKIRPEEPTPLPELSVSGGHEPTEDQLEQCQWIFDQVESRQEAIEKKAQWTFGAIIFLVPLLASVFLFLLRNGEGWGIGRILSTSIICTSATLLFLGFISALRGASVKHREELFINSVVDPQSGNFRDYDRTFHAQGLLWCAVMNTAMNDHAAQFVKGAQMLTATSVIMFVVAAIIATFDFSGTRSPAVRTEIVGPVSLSSPDLILVSKEISDLRNGLAAVTSTTAIDDRLRQLEVRISKIESVRELADDDSIVRMPGKLLQYLVSLLDWTKYTPSQTPGTGRENP